MEDHFEILSKLVKRKKPELPEHFFESFSNNLFAQSDQPEESAGTLFEKCPKPIVPVDFFQNFYDNLKSEIDAEKELDDLGLVKQKKPVLPENFENDFKVELMTQIKRGPARGRFLKISFWSAAAMLLLPPSPFY